MPCRSRWLLIVASLQLLGCPFTDSTSTGTSTACTTLEDRLRGCGLISSGHLQCYDQPQRFAGPGNQCIIACSNGASCDDLYRSTCLDPANVDPRTPLSKCIESCVQKYGYLCLSGETILIDHRCDGIGDCADLSDEQNCLTGQSSAKLCGVGVTVAPSQLCDGRVDCTDSSDEQNCPTFHCADGSEIPARLRCDHTVNCPGGLDELGCPADPAQEATFICK
jgi:hypothetical protein